MLKAFLTEYDESIGAELNIDPLGQLVIWSAFGQAIFRNRVSSISNDARNYTLNLFNHWLIKSLVEDESVVLSKALQQEYAGKTDLKFKHACLVYLENLYVFSIVAHEQLAHVVSGGVLGISKARRQWAVSENNPQLLFSHDKKAQVLVRQTLLGVSGRYKTPLLEIGFFDARYHYGLPSAAGLWHKTAQLFGDEPLHSLHGELSLHLKTLFSDNRREPTRAFNDIPQSLTRALVDVFSSSAAMGPYVRDFWLEVAGLDQGAAGALYQALVPARTPGRLNRAPAADIFALALRQPMAPADLAKLEHIRLIEPFLAELDLLFNLMLSEKTQTLHQVQQRWQAFGRKGSTLAAHAKAIRDQPLMLTVLSASGRSRMAQLLSVAEGDDLTAQIVALLAYHATVMEGRGQLPWLKLLEGQRLKLDVRPRPEPVMSERPLGAWVNQYYIPQFGYLLSGLLALST